jgi:hypothetical protein
MKKIHTVLRWAVALLLAMGAAGASAQSCTISSASVSSATPYDPFSATNNDAQGSITFSCTRPAGGANKFPATFWIGVTGTNGARALETTGGTLNYQLHTNYAGCSTAWQGATGISHAVPASFQQNADTAYGPVTVTFCMRLPAGQNTARPGSYAETTLPTVTIRSTSNTGFNWGTDSLSLSSSIDAACSFTSSPTPIDLAYTSFQTGSVSANSTFQFRCTNTTNFLLSLDATTGTLLGLNYTLALSGTSATGTGLPVSYSVTGSIAGGQSGTCANPAGCSATETRELRISY